MAPEAPTDQGDQLDQGDRRLIALVDATMDDAATSAGRHLVCRSGCTPCCFGPFSITQLDAWRLRRGLSALAATAPERAREIHDRASDTARAQEPSFPDGRAGRLGSAREERAHFNAFADTPCPALDPEDGSCQVRPWRPVACRTHGPPLRLDGDKMAHCPLCFEEATPAEVDAARTTLDVEEIETPLVERVASPGNPTDRTTVTFALAGWSDDAV